MWSDLFASFFFGFYIIGRKTLWVAGKNNPDYKNNTWVRAEITHREMFHFSKNSIYASIESVDYIDLWTYFLNTHHTNHC